MRIDQFNSLAAFADFVADVPAFNHSKMYEDRGFCRETFEESIQNARTGKPDLCQTLAANVDRIGEIIYKPDQNYTPDVTGDFFDTAAVLANLPECFWSKSQEAQQQEINIKVNLLYASMRGQGEIQNRGAAIAALVDALSQQGHVVTVQGVMRVYYRNRGYGFNIDFNNNPLDIASIAYALQSPAITRRLYFAWLEKITLEDDCDGYGQIQELEDRERQNCLYFATGYGWGRFKSIEDASEFVLEVVQEHINKREE